MNAVTGFIPVRAAVPHRLRPVVVGCGIAGLATALHLARFGEVVVLSRGSLGPDGAATAWAQGGIAAAMAADDAPSLHAADTMAAGAGLTDAAIALAVAEAAPGVIDDLARWGVPFDRHGDGSLSLGLEAAHSRRRIVHVGGDATGFGLLVALVKAVRANERIEVIEGAALTDLLQDDLGVCGLVAVRDGAPLTLATRAVILATGGVGGLYAHTTNPLGAAGAGLAIAARAGATIRDVEFVQFHPTAIAAGRDPMPLATEALRGEGAILVNDRGERFMADLPAAELSPRDVVARAVWAELVSGSKVFLDTRACLGADLPRRFPSVAALCREAGIDPVTQPIPIRPAAHYHMGGIKVDARGRSTLPGLWACGEVSATGLHGANRLASNSLLEGAAFARWIAEDIAGQAALRAPRPVECATVADAGPVDAAAIHALRHDLEQAAGVIRDADGLTQAILRVAPLAQGTGVLGDRARVALMILVGALDRQESRGAQCRRDHPQVAAEACHSDLLLHQVLDRAHALSNMPARATAFA
ncbi:L-aspartate oxidase [Zavarzinia sp. CC-PAN008]|uniref:L-aspartate oxidase n=1 Tax=Zavarzinia sp. CC-PAN008 TaxID=3243332 RepID=UPI003F742126